MRATALSAAVAALAIWIAAPAAGQTQEYELNLPGAGGGSTDPAARAGDGGSGDGSDAREPTEPEPAVAPPVETEPTVVPATPTGETERGRDRDSRRADQPRFPRGETFALGPVPAAQAEPASTLPGDDDGPWGVIAGVAAVAALLCVMALWRLRTRDASEE